MSHLVLGIDPGPTSSGHALLDIRGGSGLPLTATLMAHGTCVSEPEAFDELLRLHAPDVVAVEQADMVLGHLTPAAAHARSKQLMATERIGGQVAAVCAIRRIQCERISARQWRKAVTGSGRADDARIKSVIARLVYGWPKRSSVHVRDAAGCALAEAWARSGRRVA